MLLQKEKKDLKILCIDDNADINLLLETVLSSHGYQFACVTDGRKGLELIKQNRYDLILLDLTMPGFSGFDVLNSLGEYGLIKKQKIVIFTASSLGDDELNGIVKKEVYWCIKKPIDLDFLIQKLEEITESQSDLMD